MKKFILPFIFVFSQSFSFYADRPINTFDGVYDRVMSVIVGTVIIVTFYTVMDEIIIPFLRDRCREIKGKINEFKYYWRNRRKNKMLSIKIK